MVQSESTQTRQYLTYVGDIETLRWWDTRQTSKTTKN